MNSKLDISIIMPVYNTEDYISEAIESLLIQGLRNFEIIIVNDGSTDASQKIIDDYESRYPFIRAYHQKNQGQGKARNYGISKAKGDYVYFMDSDDILLTNSLAKAFYNIQEKNLDAYFFDGEAFFEDNFYDNIEFNYKRSKSHGYFEKGYELFNSFFNNNEILVSPCLFIVKKSVLISKNLRFPEGIKNEDLYFTMVLFFYLERVQHENYCYFKRRVRRGSTMTSFNNKQVFNDKNEVIRLLLEFVSNHSFKDENAYENLRYKIRDIIRSQLILYKTTIDSTDRNCKNQYKKMVKLGFNNRLIGIKELFLILFIKNEGDFNRIILLKSKFKN